MKEFRGYVSILLSNKTFICILKILFKNKLLALEQVKCSDNIFGGIVKSMKTEFSDYIIYLSGVVTFQTRKQE